MLGFFSVDLTIDREGRPWLIEVNGSNSGFDGFSIAYSEDAIIDAIDGAFSEYVGHRDVYVVTRLVNFGEVPRGYLEKLPRDCLLLKSAMNVLEMLTLGTVGVTWARTRADRPPSTMGAGSSLRALAQKYPRFKEVMLNVADPTYVIPSHYFKERAEVGVLSFRDGIGELTPAIPITAGDVLWLRCPTLAYAVPLPAGTETVNPEFPYDAVVDNKLFTYNLLSTALEESLPRYVPIGNRCSGFAAVEQFLEGSADTHFIRKPIAGSQGRGIEFITRLDVEDYTRRLRALELADGPGYGSLPSELQGVPEFIETGALRFDLTLLSELKLSKPVYSNVTRRMHYGCIRALGLVRMAPGQSVETRYLGAYWRLARIPTDGDGLLWERFVGSQSQGAFCEPVSRDDAQTTESFVRQVLGALLASATEVPTDAISFETWEASYWLDRYRDQVPLLRHQVAWDLFVEEKNRAHQRSTEIRQLAERVGFRRVPVNFLRAFNSSLKGVGHWGTPPQVDPLDQVARMGLPHLIRDSYRIVVPSQSAG